MVRGAESHVEGIRRTTRRQNVVLSPRESDPRRWKTRSYADASRVNEAAERECEAGRPVQFQRLEFPGLDEPEGPS